ncbi:MAG: 30S ribosomal protein S4 [Candidatus Wallbacteria bacterium]|nr:30S ribosomal protein S4 [Candidatus Wallbacteria bacterium]
MARNLLPSCRQCRRTGEKLFMKGVRCYSEKCAFERRKFAPGMQSGKRRSKLSDYGMQLNEKQKCKKMYGMMEAQFHRYYYIANKMAGVTGHNLLRLLEKRLDNALFRSGFAISRTQSRQFVRHGHVLINGKRVNIPSYQIKTGDVLEIKTTFRQNENFKVLLEAGKSREIPGWLQVDFENYKSKVLREPERADIQGTINENTIVEFYSK